jgi:hypothetical protein
MLTYIIILLILLIFRLTFDWLWIKKFNGMKPLPKMISTGICMVIIGVHLACIAPDFKHFIIWSMIISTSWSILFDPIRNLIHGKRIDYVNYDVWPDSFIYKYANNFYLFTFFRIIIIVMLYGLVQWSPIDKKQK